MSSRNDQNGRQPPLPGQPPPLSDSDCLSENVNQSDNKKEICRNFVWGTCNKSAQCKFRHELDFDEMKKILKFCHDYQNPPGCSREHCSYLHTTKEEESLFFATGQLPRILAERHANMSVTAAETIPQIALFIQESLAGHMPPPPPPPAPVSAPPPPAPATMSVTRTAPTMLPLQQLLPPPPPPTLPSTPVVPQTPIFTAPPPQNAATFPAAPSPSILPMFDGSRPPPPLPSHVQKNGSIKRTSPNQFDAQPCKVRKTEDEKVADAQCDQCVQRGIRVETYRQEMSKLHREEECQALIYKQKLQEFQNIKEVLRSLVSSDLYHLIEEYIESLSHSEVHEVLAQLNQSSTFVPGISAAMPKQFFMQLMDYVLGGRRSYESVPSSTMRLDESLLQTLIAPRRTDTTPKSDLLQTFVEILKQSSASERTPSSDFNAEILKSMSNSTNVNGFHRFSNGQKTEAAQARVGQQPYQYGPPPPAPPAPPGPPTRHYTYPPPFPAPLSGSTMGSGQLVPRAPPPPAPTAPPAPPATPAAPAPACQPYAVARYPPPFYQRHQ